MALKVFVSETDEYSIQPSGADPGFLERGSICIKVCVWGGGVSFTDFISFYLKIP